MKIKHIIIIFLIGLTLLTTGALFKIMHWPGANIMISISLALKGVAGLLAIWKVMSSDRYKEFLNS